MIYLIFSIILLQLYSTVSIKIIQIYSNSLGAHWISMVSSYQWWSAKIPRKKSKRPIAMQPCPKSDQDSIPQSVKSLVLFSAVFMTKRLWQLAMTSCWLSAWYDPQQRVSIIFSISGSAEVMTCHQIRCTTRSWSPWTKLLLSFHVLLLWRIDRSSCSRRYISTLSTIGHRKKSSDWCVYSWRWSDQPISQLLRFACQYFASCSWPSALHLEC